MKKTIAIIAGEPNSISSEIIFKSWKLRKKYTHKPFIIIGSIKLLNLQKKKLKYKFKIKKITNNFLNKDLVGNEIPVYDVNYIQRKPFKKISTKSNNYILKCFDVALSLIRNKKIYGLINCPINKETLFKKKNHGITEFLSKKTKTFGDEVMLLYNKKLSVSPLTRHIPIKRVSGKLNKTKIIKNIKVINNFYKTKFNKKPNIGILGLNPHNYSTEKKSEEEKIIIPAIKVLRKKGIKIIGPISPDTSFLIINKKKIDVMYGMYHDQVLTTFKALYEYDAINITLGLPFIRISPDHGVAINILGKNIANPKSLIEAIKFFNII